MGCSGRQRAARQEREEQQGRRRQQGQRQQQQGGEGQAAAPGQLPDCAAGRQVGGGGSVSASCASTSHVLGLLHAATA